ncbi:MAG: cation diffusion facilitator family transporter [Candidatus Bathyarchaeia archaeon]
MSSASAEAFQAGERIARLSVITLLGIGIVELTVGYWTGSLGLKADGLDSVSDSVISLIVWLGLHYSRRRPDARFHFGYQKVESLSALVVSIGMVGLAAYVMLQSYLTFLNPRPIVFPTIALATVLACGTISMYRAFQMRGIANKYGLLSLRTDANNSIKDGTASFVVFVSVLGASLGIRELDAVGGMIIAIYIFGVAYIAFRESSLVLLDACESPELTSALSAALKTVEGVRGVASIRLRPSGPYLTGIIAVLVDGSKTVTETENLRRKLLETVWAIVEPIGEISIVFRPEA